MKQIQIHSFLSTEICTEFKKIINIDIDDRPFAEGGFGEVYHCIAINGNKLGTPQVIKIFKENFPGSADENFRTIERLQEKFKYLNNELLNQNKNLIKEFPAFVALPQFSFIGYLNGRLVKGFSSDNLTKLGYFEFERILSNTKLLEKFYKIPIPRRIYFAYQLASAFKVLADFKYIHADLKPAAIFLNLDNQELAIIDYDSGVITESINDKPTTWGSPNDWVAPEIWEQQINRKRGHKLIVDSFTDRWSVAIGVNYLITGIHPLFYLTELGPAVTKMYFESKQWPDADINGKYFCKENEYYYNQYLSFINSEIPSQIKESMSFTINFGYKTPAARTNYKDWQTVLKSIQLPPTIKFLSVSKNEILEGESVTIAWSAENANSVQIENILGNFGAIDKKAFKPKSTNIYKITFLGYYGEISERITIKVTPAPKFNTLKADTPKVKHGNSTTISWDIENVSKILLHGLEANPVIISQKGKKIIKPVQTTTYRFEVIALDGKTQKEEFITIEVFEEGEIFYFKADKQYIFPTIPVTLSWAVQNALKVEIEGIGQFQLAGQTIVYPIVDTIYRIIVTDNFGSFTEEIQIKMLPLPVIEKLIIQTPIIQSSSTINLSIPYPTNNLPLLNNSVKFNYSKFDIKINSTLFNKNVQIKEMDFVVVKTPFIKRAKTLISSLIYLLQNEKYRIYATKK